MNLAWFGLGLIIVGWAIQLFNVLKGSKEIKPCFIGVQAVGIMLLVISSWESDIVLALLNLGSFTVSGLVLVFFMVKFGCPMCSHPKAKPKKTAK